MNDFPALEPITSPWMERVLDSSDLVDQLFETHGSPINVHCADSFEDNARAYSEVMAEMNLRHQIYFARKANRCRGFVSRAERIGIGVDTASYRELEESLKLGCPPERLVVTAAVKNRQLVELAVMRGVTIILDNEDECLLVNEVAKRCQQKAHVGFRISGFRVGGEKLFSRFGFDIDDVIEVLTRSLGDASSFSNLNYRGLHFHLNGYSIRERATALLEAVGVADELSEKLGLDTDFIDIGGGLLVNYLRHQEQWENFDRELRRALLAERKPVTFDNDGLGYRVQDGEIVGQLETYPFWNEVHGAGYLRAVMDYGDGETPAAALKRRNIELRIEPGRSLLDQSGMTLARVAFRKRDSKGRHLIGLEMNFTQMRSGSADFLLDPVLVPMASPVRDGQAVDVYFSGAYCLERDILLRRKVRLERLPEVGDAIAFVNTAGYLMHFFESEAHLFPLAANLFLESTAEDLEAGHFHLD